MSGNNDPIGTVGQTVGSIALRPPGPISPRQPNESDRADSVVARSALWRIVEVSGAEFLSFAVIIILARLLLPEDYGLVAIATVIILAGQMLVYHGLAEVVIQREDLEPAHLSSAFWANIGVGVLLTLLMIAMAGPIAVLTGKPGFAAILIALSPSMISFAIVGIYQARMRRDMAFKGLAIRSIASILAGGIAGTIAALNGWGAWSLVAQQLAYAAMNVAVIVWFSQWHPRFAVSLSHLSEMFLFGWRIALTWLLELFARNGTILILGIFLDAALVGLYFVANRIFLAVSHLTFWSIGEISLPVLSRLQGNLQAEVRASLQTLSMTTLLCISCFWGLAAVAEPLVLLLFGEHWLDSVLPLQILAAIGILNALTSTTCQILVSFGHPAVSLRIQSMISSVQLALVLLAAPFGLVPAALSIAATFVLATPYALWQLKTLVGISLRELLTAQLPLWTAAFTMALSVIMVHSILLDGYDALPRLVAGMMAGAVVYTGILWQLTPDLLAQVSQSLRGAISKRS